jgi:hypothetical protein
MPEKLIIITVIEFVCPPLVAALMSFFGSPIISAIAIGFGTKILILLFDKQVRYISNEIKSTWKKYVLKRFKK